MDYFKQFITLPKDEEQFAELITKAKDYALMHGAGIRPSNNFNPDALQFVPFVLTPSPFPRAEFEKVVALQTTLNELMHAVAHDDEFLSSVLASTIKVDDFTAKLFHCYKSIKPKKDALSLTLIRSDYLPHKFEGNSLKQVEINTIASSFGALATILRDVHCYVLGELDEYEKIGKNLPQNDALHGLCDGMLRAWEMYGAKNAVILFVVEDVTNNICDQRFIEYEIRKAGVKVIRKTLSELNIEAELNKNDELVVEGDLVSVVYFRAGYDGAHYPSEREWNARCKIEKSSAIKCPTINYHLSGTKKVQQELAKEENLRRFLKDEAKIQAVKAVFTGLYSLDKNDADSENAVKMALAEPERFVLKPQREGGGHNIYGADIPSTLKKLTEEERSAYILMDRILPPMSKGFIIRPGQKFSSTPSDLVSELGIFGIIIGTKDKILYNKQGGHILRTKLAESNETGVNAGLGVLDTPFLFD
ncbi:glutathione synthetase-like [Culicoides brevitarsis]|uniref:glutathione synthetase-like n=1 Tax=Culicoides brevitarsis TaxID=469753 RepID=UPI00307CAF48